MTSFLKLPIYLFLVLLIIEVILPMSIFFKIIEIAESIVATNQKILNLFDN